jgi:hypothetical protein
MGVAQGEAWVMLAGVPGRPAEGCALPGHPVEVGRAGALEDHQLAPLGDIGLALRHKLLGNGFHTGFFAAPVEAGAPFALEGMQQRHPA